MREDEFLVCVRPPARCAPRPPHAPTPCLMLFVLAAGSVRGSPALTYLCSRSRRADQILAASHHAVGKKKEDAGGAAPPPGPTDAITKMREQEQAMEKRMAFLQKKIDEQVGPPRLP
eukprot:SAG22_NODE_6462_length_851_cov_0.865691_1_plen_117_part_00